MEWENWESTARKDESIVIKWSVEVEREYEKEDRENMKGESRVSK